MSLSQHDLTVARRGPAVVAMYVALAVIAVAFVLPFFWMVLASVTPHSALSAEPGGSLSLVNYQTVLTPDTVYTPMLNSLIICGGAALIAVLVAIFAAYPLSRYESRFGRSFLYTILFSTGLPITAVMVPVYTMFDRLNLIDSIPATVAFMATASLPFAIWLMKNFMDAVPVDLEEAAWCDGASWFQSLRRLILPLMVPGLSVVFIFTVVALWGNFFVPFILLTSPDKLPASVIVWDFFGEHGEVAFGQLAAFSVIYTTPIILLYLALSRFFGRAFSLSGAVKG